MRLQTALGIGLLAVILAAGCATENPVSRGGFAVLKVNRTLLDQFGHETDVVGDLQGQAAYQYDLRHDPFRQRGARFHIKWKAPRRAERIRLVLDLQGLNPANESTRATVAAHQPDMDGWAEWTTLDIKGQQFKKLGEIMAWRVTLYSGDQVMAELPSANWYSDIRAEVSAK
jgi:hypothetical protein